MRKCNSVTLVWDASPDERVFYCILQRDASIAYSSFEESKDLCDKIQMPSMTKRNIDNDLDDDRGNFEEDRQFKSATRQVVCKR